MAISQPASSDALNSPDHSLMHRIIATDPAASVQSLVVNSAGNVGIGDIAPNQLLGLKGTNAQISIEEDDTAFLRVGVGETDGTAVIGYDDGDKLQLGVYSSPTDTTITPYVTVDSSGNVGIGTDSPGEKLRIFEATGTGIQNGLAIYFGEDGTGNGGRLILGSSVTSAGAIAGLQGSDNTKGYLAFYTVNSGFQERMRILEGGNVGIGTASPTVGTGWSAPWLTVSSNDVGIALTDSDNADKTRHMANSAGNFYMGIMDDDGANMVHHMTILEAGSVGIGTTNPTNLLSLGGESARIFWMERELTANTAGNTLTITAGGATTAATDKAGGALILQGGLSTGSAESGVTIQGCVAGAGGTADRTQTTEIQVLGNKIGFYGVTPITRAVLATGGGATVDNVITALQNLGLVSQS